MSSTSATIFNQYYFDVLKKIRDLARKRKHHDPNARRILKAIKENYLSWDRLSGEFQQWFNALDWESYVAVENESLDEWSKGPGANIEVYKSISVKSLYQILKESATLHHFLTVLCIFRNAEMTADEVEATLNVVKEPSAESDNALVKRLAYLNTIRPAPTAPAEGMLKEIENTTIGKLAKEIMSEINIEELQGIAAGAAEGGDILKTLAAPNNGLVNLLGTVSQKMISKMASGEISQETLLEDAMKFASNLGGGGAGGGLGALTKMMSAMGGPNALSKMMGGSLGGGSSRSRRRRMQRKAGATSSAAAAENIQTNVEA